MDGQEIHFTFVSVNVYFKFTINSSKTSNIGTLSVQELFFQLIGLLGGRLGVSPVGMVELFVHGASLTT